MKILHISILTLAFCISSFTQHIHRVGSLRLDSIQIGSGWNLLSLPLHAADSNKSSLFPAAVSSAFIYQNGYVAKDTLQNGYGFWLKFDSAETVYIAGEVISRDTIEVRTGWNMIGTLSFPIVAGAMQTDPAGIIVSDIFYFANGTYHSTDTLRPRSGYWVKVTREGSIILSSLPISCDGTPTVDYASKTYNTVQIGGQCWLRENLDIGTMIMGADTADDNEFIEKYCYNDSTENCEIYGGLYQWNEAMQYSNVESVRGICPTGWHIPTLTDFQALKNAVENDGNALKAIGQGSASGAGTNASGFSALLSGFRLSYGFFSYLGTDTYFATSTETDSVSAGGVSLDNSSSNIVINYDITKRGGFSIRCLRDETPQTPDLSSPLDHSVNIPAPPLLIWRPSDGAASYTLQVSTDSLFSSFVYNQNELLDTFQQITGLNNSTRYYWRCGATNSYGTSGWSAGWSFTTGTTCPGVPTVEYEGNTYNTIQIGGQCWLKENLKVGTLIPGNTNASNNSTVEKYCYNDSILYCDRYGGLYQWNEAMQYSTTGGARGICPPEWHLPTALEFENLNTASGGSSNSLKAVGEGTGSGAGTNSSGFTALLAGYRSGTGEFSLKNVNAHFWGSTQYDSANAGLMGIVYNDDHIYLHGYYKDHGFSVRCVKN